MKARGGSLDLFPSHILTRIQRLPMEVGDIHPIELHDSHGSNPARDEVMKGWASQTPSPDDEGARRLESLLAFIPNIGKAELPGVPAAVVRGQAHESR